jgi:hypothetical protein
MTSISIPYAQAAWFRARRTGLVTPFADPVAAAGGILGAQAQIEAPARWALALRSASGTGSATIRRLLLEERTLIRAWGQRDTVHLYDRATWPLIATAQTLWPRTARGGTLPSDTEIADFVHWMSALGRPFTRSDAMQMVPGRLVDGFAAAPVNNDPPERMAATRLIWRAGTLGWLSTTDTVGREQAYAARTWWMPDLVWTTLTPEEASIEVTLRYVRAWGPARAHDVAHYLGANVRDARRWLEALRDVLLPVTVDGLADHWIHRDDREALLEPAPDDDAAWPARLLPAYDTQMMSHATKQFVLPHEPDRKRVWDKAAIVNPTLLYRGRFVATWKHTVKGKALAHEVAPLSDAPAAALHPDALSPDLQRLRAHLGIA